MIDKTIEQIKKRLCNPLNADLAFIGECHNLPEDRVIKNNFKFVYKLTEPSNWISELDKIDPSKSWRDVANVHSFLLGGTGLGSSTGSGAIIFYYRMILRKFFKEYDLKEYDWFVITRSDFLWLVTHPPVELLDVDKIYLLNGQSYGGVCDRHFIVSKNNIAIFLEIPVRIFNDGTKLARELLQSKAVNPEMLNRYRLKQLGLEDKCNLLPYMGALIRTPETSTRWSYGIFIDKLNIFIKYPMELRQALLLLLLFPRKLPWYKYLNNGKIFRLYIFSIIFKFSIKIAKFGGQNSRIDLFFLNVFVVINKFYKFYNKNSYF